MNDTLQKTLASALQTVYTFNNDGAALGAVLTGALGGGFFVFGFIYNLEQALKIYLAPRIYLLDWLVELLKK